MLELGLTILSSVLVRHVYIFLHYCARFVPETNSRFEVPVPQNIAPESAFEVSQLPKVMIDSKNQL